MLARLCVLGVVLGACAPVRSDGPLPPPRPIGQVELETLDGQKTPIATVVAGRPALLSLWATWCESCATEFSALGRLEEKAKEQGAYVVAIDEGEPRQTVADFVKGHALTYPQLVDEPFALGDAIGARRVPTTIVLDRQGAIVFRGGALDREALVALDKAIAAR